MIMMVLMTLPVVIMLLMTMIFVVMIVVIMMMLMLLFVIIVIVVDMINGVSVCVCLVSAVLIVMVMVVVLLVRGHNLPQDLRLQIGSALDRVEDLLSVELFVKNSPKFLRYSFALVQSTTVTALLSFIPGTSAAVFSMARITSSSFPTPEGSMRIRSGA